MIFIEIAEIVYTIFNKQNFKKNQATYIYFAQIKF